jgi:hypothetical protein
VWATDAWLLKLLLMGKFTMTLSISLCIFIKHPEWFSSSMLVSFSPEWPALRDTYWMNEQWITPSTDDLYSLGVTVMEQYESSWQHVLEYDILKSVLLKSIVLAFRCIWTPLQSESLGYRPELVWSISCSLSVGKEVRQFCTSLWEQLRKWTVSSFLRSSGLMK